MIYRDVTEEERENGLPMEALLLSKGLHEVDQAWVLEVDEGNLRRTLLTAIIEYTNLPEKGDLGMMIEALDLIVDRKVKEILAGGLEVQT